MDDYERMDMLLEIDWLVDNVGTYASLIYLDSILQNDENDLDILFQKSIIYYVDLKLNKALNVLNHILKINPKYLDALLLKGEIFVGFHEHDKAIETFNKIHPKILPYAYKKLIEYISEFSENKTKYYKVFEFNSNFEYIYIEYDIFRKVTDNSLENLKNNIYEKGLIWLEIDSEADLDVSYHEYFLYKPVKPTINIVSGIRLSDEEPNVEIEENNIENCIVCGKKLKKNQKNICRSCFKKQYASRIIKKLVSVVKPQVTFKKRDLNILNLDDVQIQDYIWTLQEFDLIDVDNEKF